MAPVDQARLTAARAMVSHVAEHLRADLSIELWNGEVLPLGPGARDDIRLVIRSPDVIRRLILRPVLMSVFELIAAAELEVVGGDPMQAADRWDHARVIHLVRNLDRMKMIRLAVPFLLGPRHRAPARAEAAPAYDTAVGAHYAGDRDDKALIQFHYDVSNAFFALFLDPEMVYSSAYFWKPDASLEEAQFAKLDQICRKLRLKPGDRLLDIGCGWGGLACHAARHFGAIVHGVTLSQAQLDYATAKIARLGLQDQVTVELRDYRAIEGEALYDKVSQVEMFEHVGFENHDRHFQHVHRLLKPRGVYFHQASVRRVDRDLSRFRWPTPTTRVITRLIFPGGELDYIGLTVTNLGRMGFEVQDVENLREHFEMTLREWVRRLYANREAAAQEVGWARTRLWLIYFTAFAKGFERGMVLVYQTVASKRAFGASGLPLSRADLYVRELGADIA
jgi:cyclopropane-fatty-acyl-phospholipid synthase